ncbi:hypothetical protein GOBAR_AA11809 [Gossypium barbadense]|uniref:Arabidopsis retrotransposon Orf1 C-terminal domain-containing protein n=1 Tax=Gossypium barbadense TaxID=3634 RepID=A0A2P5XZR1_GOSBA|nr:hypothetical protein GOBAR_AA11809 [Gossypium barbadense]
MMKPTLHKISLKEAHESFSSNSRGPAHEDRRLHVEELDEWRTHKPRTPDKPKLRQNKLDTSPNQLKVGDKVLLDATDPHIVTTTPNEEIPLTVLSIFPFGRVEVSHPKFGTFKVNITRLKPYFDEIDSRNEEYHVIVKRKENHRTYFKEEEGSILFHGPNRGNLSPSPTVSPRAPGRTVPNTSSPTLNCRPLYRLDYEFQGENELHALSRHIHFSLSKCWHTLAPSTASYNPSRSKASVLPPSLRYLHAILAHTITGRRESTGVVNIHNIYFLWCMSQGYIIDLAYFITLAIQHQTEWHRNGMSPQGISSMLSMRMIEMCRGTYPPQYRLAQSIEEEAYENIPDDVPPQHEGPPTQPPPPSRPVLVVASYTDISERLTLFE